jgi:hypothetical protein
MSTKHVLSVARMREALFAWYAKEERAGRRHPRVNQFSSTVLGTPSERVLRTMGAATNGLLYFAQHLLEKVGHVLGPKRGDFGAGLRTLISIHESMQEHRRRYPPQALQAFVKDVCEHMQCLRRLDIKHMPKHHLMIDLAGRL